MTKILSKENKDNLSLQVLKDMLEIASDGAITKGGVIEPATTLEEAVDQVDIVFVSMMDAIDDLEVGIDLLKGDIEHLEDVVAAQEAILLSLETVAFDEDLDFATGDFMDTLLGAGVVEPTFDGEISFSADVTFKKSDLKPFLKHAIQEWVDRKFR